MRRRSFIGKDVLSCSDANVQTFGKRPSIESPGRVPHMVKQAGVLEVVSSGRDQR